MKRRAQLQRKIISDWQTIRHKAATIPLSNQTRILPMYFARLPKRPRIKILGTSIKVEHGQKEKVLTAIAYLSPATESGKVTCAWLTAACALACLGHTSGQLAMSPALNSRLWKTALYFGDRKTFRALLAIELDAHEHKAIRKGMHAAARLDGSTDLGEAIKMAKHFPGISFYDYTKSVARAMRAAKGHYPPNYDVVFSRSGENDADCLKVLRSGGNVAVVYDVMPGKNGADPGFPKRWNGYKTINGDETDIRFRDPSPRIVALSFKGLRNREQHRRNARSGNFLVMV